MKKATLIVISILMVSLIGVPAVLGSSTVSVTDISKVEVKGVLTDGENTVLKELTAAINKRGGIGDVEVRIRTKGIAAGGGTETTEIEGVLTDVESSLVTKLAETLNKRGGVGDVEIRVRTRD